MDGQIQHVFGITDRVVVNTSDGSSYVGNFNNFDFPFASFTWDDLGRVIYINIEHICSVYAMEETAVHPDYHQTRQGGRILGQHSSTVGEVPEHRR